MKQFLAIVMSVLFVMPMSNILIDDEMTFAGYNGASLENTVSLSIDFAYKEDNEVLINGGLPEYCDWSSRENTCANVAGAIVLGYYDKTHDELIENFTSARIIRDKVLYSKQSDAVDGVLSTLYTAMKTNITEGGTTIDNFKTGLTDYVNEREKNIAYSQVVSNQELNLNTYANAITNKEPTVLFISKYSLISMQSFDVETGTQNLNIQHYTGNHTVVAYGLRTIKYYNASGTLVRQMNLLAVATGMSYGYFGYILLDDYGTLIDGYSINIY